MSLVLAVALSTLAPRLLGKSLSMDPQKMHAVIQAARELDGEDESHCHCFTCSFSSAEAAFLAAQ